MSDTIDFMRLIMHNARLVVGRVKSILQKVKSRARAVVATKAEKPRESACLFEVQIEIGRIECKGIS